MATPDVSLISPAEAPISIVTAEGKKLSGGAAVAYRNRQIAEAARQRRDLAALDTLAALVEVAGRDLVLRRIAERQGTARAVAAADVLGLAPGAFTEEQDRQVTQRNLSRTFDPWDDDRVMSLIAGGKATDDPEVIRMSELVTAEHQRDSRFVRIGEFFRDEPVVEVSRTLTTKPENEDWEHDDTDAILRGASLSEISQIRQQARAEREQRAAAPSRRVSAPPMSPASPTGA